MIRSLRTAPLVAVTALIITGLGLAGCGSDSVGPSGNSTALVKSINGLQSCPGNIDFTQMGVVPPTFVNVPYAVAPAAGYGSIRAGVGLNYGIYTTGNTTNPLATASIDLNPHDPNGNPNSGAYTLVATGICGAPAGTTTPHLIRLVDAFPFTFGGSAANTVGLRVINLVPDVSGGISLYSNGAALHGSDDAGTNNVAYAATSGFDSTHYNSGLNLSGSPVLTIRTNANSILATVPAFNFAGNHAYTLYVFGEANPTAGGQSISVVPVQDF